MKLARSTYRMIFNKRKLSSKETSKEQMQDEYLTIRSEVVMISARSNYRMIFNKQKLSSKETSKE